MQRAAEAAGTTTTRIEGCRGGFAGLRGRPPPERCRVPATSQGGTEASARTTLAAQSDTRVAVGNDVQVATSAEFELGAGRPYNSLLGTFWGTGIGGGLILDGEPWHGPRRRR